MILNTPLHDKTIHDLSNSEENSHIVYDNQQWTWHVHLSTLTRGINYVAMYL